MKPVTVYSKPNCVQCTAVKRWLVEQSVPFDAVDVSQDKDGFDHIVALGYRQVPVVTHGDSHFYGYQPARLQAIFDAMVQG